MFSRSFVFLSDFRGKMENNLKLLSELFTNKKFLSFQEVDKYKSLNQPTSCLRELSLELLDWRSREWKDVMKLVMLVLNAGNTRGVCVSFYIRFLINSLAPLWNSSDIPEAFTVLRRLTTGLVFSCESNSSTSITSMPWSDIQWAVILSHISISLVYLNILHAWINNKH